MRSFHRTSRRLRGALPSPQSDGTSMGVIDTLSAALAMRAMVVGDCMTRSSWLGPDAEPAWRTLLRLDPSQFGRSFLCHPFSPISK